MPLKRIIKSVFECTHCGRKFNAYDIIRKSEKTYNAHDWAAMFNLNRARAQRHANACALREVSSVR